MDNFTLEIACFSTEAAIKAAAAGAHRIEICDNQFDGGTTPSAGVLKSIREKITIPIFPMIRPRGGHFVFYTLEVEIMTTDIKYCKSLGYEGVVVGALNENGTVDYDTTARWVELAYPMEVTFHRAFDRTTNPYEALETLIKAGCNRVLTSGQHADVHNGTNIIKRLIEQAAHNIIVMPGCGIKSDSIAAIAAQTGATEFHASAKTEQLDAYPTPGTMLEKLSQITVDQQEVKKIKAELSQYFKLQQD